MRIRKFAKGKIVLFLVFALLLTAACCYGTYKNNFIAESQQTVAGSRFKAIFYNNEALTINYDADVHPYDKKLFSQNEKGWLTYNSDDVETSYGVDVSFWQENIDWNKVKADGIDFAIIRIGYRGYGQGTLNKDDDFAKNLAEAKEAGLKVGVYFFSQALNKKEAVEEAKYVLELLDGYEIDMPVVFDWEPQPFEGSRTLDVPGEKITDACIAFCDTIEKAGYQSLIYIYRDLAYYKLGLERLNDYDIWLAEYNEVPTYYYDYEMIQFTCTGSVDGINGDVDINLSFKDYSKE